MSETRAASHKATLVLGPRAVAMFAASAVSWRERGLAVRTDFARPFHDSGFFDVVITLRLDGPPAMIERARTEMRNIEAAIGAQPPDEVGEEIRRAYEDSDPRRRALAGKGKGARRRRSTR